tara:strand:- start:182 stop:382 length:201 start_codon:yes stop_codon:yes gene_type:complete
MIYRLLSSAPSLDLLKDCLKRYFCGEEFELKKRPYNETIVIYKNNTCLEHYRIIKKKNRYRFEGAI